MSKLNLKDYGIKIDNVRKRIGEIEIYEFNNELKEEIIQLISNTNGDEMIFPYQAIRNLIKKTTNFGNTVDCLSDEELDDKIKNNRDLELMTRELIVMAEEIVDDIWYKQTQELKAINSMLNIIQKSSDVNEINNKLNKILKKNKVKSIEELINKTK